MYWSDWGSRKATRRRQTDKTHPKKRGETLPLDAQRSTALVTLEKPWGTRDHVEKAVI